MTPPSLSIIIPGYNSSSYIDATLNSLGNQKYKDFEVIYVDDQSTDNSIAVATGAMKKYSLSGRVLVRPSDMARGVANARNWGIKNAEGEWISFLDSDDLFLPEKMLRTYELIQKYGESCPAYFHAIREFEDGTNKTLAETFKTTYTEPGNIFGELINKNIIATSTVTLRKSLLTEFGGFDCRLNGVEDYLLWLRIAKKNSWFYSGEMWTDYRIRATSLMGGREMSHYVAQSVALYSSARILKEFTVDELAKLDNNLFRNSMQGYALISLNGRGWRDFIRGLTALGKAGKSNLAFWLFRKHMRNLALRKLQQVVRGKR